MCDTGKSIKTGILLLIGGFGLTCLSAHAEASDIDELCSGTASLTTGQWARYAADAAFMREKVEIRYAIVGTEADHYWMEFEAAMPTGTGATIIKILIPGWPFAVESIKKAQMQLPVVQAMDPIPPMEMPPANIQKDNLSGPLRMACEEREDGVQDTVTVPAGTFSALRIPLKVMDDEIWISSSVPFGVIKIADAEGNGLELIDFGNDAESAILDKP